MSRRVVTLIDKLSHINDVTFKVYRSNLPVVDDEDLHIMDVFDPMAIKNIYTEQLEQLIRDPLTPNIFYCRRHFETNPFPIIKIGGDFVSQDMITLYPEQKMIEINGYDLGVGDTRKTYMTYDYQATPAKDDYPIQSGVTYYGPPATGLRPPKDVEFEHHIAEQLYEVRYTPDLEPVPYYYRIRAFDTDGNKSDYAEELKIEMVPDTSQLYFRIQRSNDGNNWTDVTLTMLTSWFDQLYPAGPPANVQNLTITPLELKKAQIVFDNPWYHYNTYPRQMYRYRVRSEDFDGEASEWIYLNSPPEIFLKPKEILIRRKVHNGNVATKNGTDAINFMKLKETDVDVNDPYIRLVDDQLSEGFVYSWTFFYTDEINLEAAPIFAISDHTGGAADAE